MREEATEKEREIIQHHPAGDPDEAEMEGEGEG
jgi:hypothetical protein